MSCISLVRYLSDHAGTMPVSAMTHLIIDNDIVMGLIPLIEKRPWLRTNQQGQREKWEDSRWQAIPKDQMGKLPKIEGQVWITVYNLLMT